MAGIFTLLLPIYITLTYWFWYHIKAYNLRFQASKLYATFGEQHLFEVGEQDESFVGEGRPASKSRNKPVTFRLGLRKAGIQRPVKLVSLFRAGWEYTTGYTRGLTRFRVIPPLLIVSSCTPLSIPVLLKIKTQDFTGCWIPAFLLLFAKVDHPTTFRTVLGAKRGELASYLCLF